MGSIYFTNVLRVFKNICKSKKLLQIASNKKQPRLSRSQYKLILAFLFLCLSFFISLSAYNVTSDQAVKSWIANNVPKKSDFLLISKTFKFREVTYLDLLHASIRSLPSQTDLNGSLWMSSDGFWVAYYYDENYASIPLIMTSHFDIYTVKSKIKRKKLSKLKKLIPENWNYLGRGWPALQLFLNSYKIPKKSKSINLWKDPRQIYY